MMRNAPLPPHRAVKWPYSFCVLFRVVTFQKGTDVRKAKKKTKKNKKKQKKKKQKKKKKKKNKKKTKNKIK